jgi:hypothetical protein
MADLTLAQILALLADNTTGDISAADVRDVSTALFERTDGTNAVAALLFDVATPDAPGAHTPGHLHWNTTDGMLEIQSDYTGVTLQVGHEQWVTVRNNSGSTILNGTAVRITGAVANLPTVGPDNGLGTVIGVTTHDIANNSNGKVTTFGLVRDINTSAFSAGDRVYGSPTGTLTAAVTSSFLGRVLDSHVSQGAILVTRTLNTSPDGTTAERPTTVALGYMFFDTTLGHPVWWDGTNWVDATGGVV